MSRPSRDAQVDVSVLVPVLNEGVHLGETMGTVLDQRFSGTFEVLVIDGGSTDGSREALRELASRDPRIRLLDNPARRTPQALNVGLREARGEFVARMDAHAIYPLDYLANGVARLTRGGVASVAGPALAVGRGGWSPRVSTALRTRLGVGAADFRLGVDEEIEVESGAFGVWRRETLLGLGGWDEGWPTNQDAELAARLRAAGGKIVCLPEMAARYVPRSSLASLARQYWRYGHYRVKTARRHPQALRRSHLAAPSLAAVAPVALTRSGAVSRVARATLIAYAAALVVTSARAARSERGSLADVAALPPVFAVIHFAWGAGFWAGLARFGVPWQAILIALGAHRSERDALDG